MKHNFKPAMLALAGVVAFTSQAMAAITIESGGLAVAFYSTNPLETNTYVFDLGKGADFRENTGYNVPVTTVNTALTSANIGADLVSNFGADWYNTGDVRWYIVGTVNAGAAVDSDPARTSYYSLARNSYAASTTWGSTLSSTQRGTLNTQISNFNAGTNNAAAQTVGNNGAGAVIAKSSPQSADEYVLPANLNAFGINIDPQQTFGAGSITDAPVGSLEGALDIYRIIHTTTGADLTAGYSPTNAVAGSGQYIGTLAINSSGLLTVIPEPSSMLLGLAGALGLCVRRRR
ncbi:MAG: PEP-CTERM sorting domain-containing protein [Verrucomicrobia bacterium]|nr:PEP-CTERM sorting domain-containing protein [Verrucomicrobiota bacterium]